MSIPILQDWWVLPSSRDIYRPPETRSLTIVGIVKGHPSQEDGKCIHTSAVIRIDGCTVYTRNRTYRLGRIQPAYRKWLQDSGHDYDPRNPIKMKQIHEAV